MTEYLSLNERLFNDFLFKLDKNEFKLTSVAT